MVIIPPSQTTVSVSIVDTTSSIRNFPISSWFKPNDLGIDKLECCAYAFLITHNGRSIVFDLGIKKDWSQLVPSLYERIKSNGAEVHVEREIVDIIRDGGTEFNTVDSVIWSHLHWDHTGNLASFPSSVNLVVGPGIVDRYMPGWPKVDDAAFRETDVGGRKVNGIEKGQFSVKVGDFDGYDYFGDGSFFLLDAPGHALGQLNALARTSVNPDTFIFLAADSVHLGGELRPSGGVPIPDSVDVSGLKPRPCPAELLLALHPEKSRTEPYLKLTKGFPDDLDAANATIGAIAKFDADDRVLVIWAHDLPARDVYDIYPATANDWKAKGWKAASRWKFLKDLQESASKA